ncbi:MAG: hypothetical protein FWF22_01825 [Treponema sp.]|nr:hypothetical protein [Treponema sp.]
MISEPVKKTWNDFWAGKNREPVYAITVPKNGKEIIPQPPYLSWFNGNFMEAADTLARWYESCEFYGAAIPFFPMSFGADDFAALTGSDLSFTPYTDGSGSGTSWAHRTIDNLENADIRFDPNGKWWNKISEFYRVLRMRLGDAVMISPPTLSAGLDALSAFYGPESLLTDLVDNPEQVHNMLDLINGEYTKTVKACADLFEFEKYGNINRHGAYSSGYVNVVQCDFSCMISPDFFEEFAMQSIAHEFSFTSGGEYHLDGPGALKHLDRLLKIPELDIIQWVSGAGFGENQDWTDLFKKVLKSGKGLLMGTSADDALALLRKYKSKRIYLIIHGVKSRTEAEDLLAEAGKIHF